jgi:hypothetical protein
MRLKIAILAFAVVALPFAAQAQQKPAAARKPTVADIQRVVKIVSSDKAKTKAICDLAKLDDQIGAAEEKKDTKKVEELTKMAESLQSKTGPEYASLMESLEDVNPESADGKKLATALEAFDKLCP